MIFTFSQYIIDVDVKRTRQFYETAPAVTASCTCQGCRNYERAILQLSKKAWDFLTSLGVDPRKPAEVFDYSPLNKDGTVLYGGFYHLCGKLLNAPELLQPTEMTFWEKLLSGKNPFKYAPSKGRFAMREEAFYRPDDALTVYFQENCDLLEDSFPTPVIQMDIEVRLPWLLDKTYEA